MTEIAVRDETLPAVPPVDAPTSALLLWANEARQAAQIATSLARTSFVPASLRGKPEDITAAILAGQELGLKPMASLRSMDIIQGTPALRAHAMRGLIQSHGHTVQLVDATDTRCVMRGRRAGEAEWQEVEWTLDRAALLGLTGKSEWKKQPKTMLIARATGEICRLIAADVLHAMPYASEEIDEPEAGAAPLPAARVTVAELLGQRAEAAPPSDPTPAQQPAAAWPPMHTPADDDPTDRSGDAVAGRPVDVSPSREEVVASVGQPRPLTDRQRNTINAIAPKVGMKDRDILHHWLTSATGRDINSVNDLTNREASAAIDLLQDLEQRESGGGS